MVGALDDTWTWDGATWKLRNVVGPSARQEAAAVSVRGSVMLFGGAGADDFLGDTWIWDGAAWTQQNVAGPGARLYAAMSGP
jgi:hypothetical protein